MKKTPHSDIRLFMRLEPDIPKLTHQNGIRIRSARGDATPRIFKAPALRALEAKYISLLSPFAPREPWNCPIALTTEWVFRKPRGARGIFKTTKPDTDNLVKTLKDCMTRCGFWKDDALVCEERCTKLWAEEDEPHGIIIHIQDRSLRDGEDA